MTATCGNCGLEGQLAAGWCEGCRKDWQNERYEFELWLRKTPTERDGL